MRAPRLSLPRLLIVIGIVTALGLAIALPSLLDGHSASQTGSVVIGDEREERSAPAGGGDGPRQAADGAKKGPRREERGPPAAAPVHGGDVEDDEDLDEAIDGGTDD